MGSLDPEMLTFANFKETYGKLNYEILLLTSLRILRVLLIMDTNIK